MGWRGYIRGQAEGGRESEGGELFILQRLPLSDLPTPLSSETVLTGFEISIGVAILFYSIGASQQRRRRHLLKFMRLLLEKDFHLDFLNFLSMGD